MILSMSAVLDYQIINALQIHPRVSWARLARILNVDASTISRRWQALVADGMVWSSCFEAAGPRGSHASEVAALVEIRCRPGSRGAVVTALNHRQQVFSVNCTSGQRDVYIMVSTRTLAGMDAFVEEHIASIDGVVSTQTHYLRSIFFESSYWRLNHLTPAQVSALEHLRPDTVPGPPKAEHRAIVEALGEDVRRTAADVQRDVQRPLGSVTRGIEAILASDWVRWRIDFAQPLMEWTAGAVLWMDVPQAVMPKVAGALRSIPNARMCASVTGQANLALTLWLHELHELDEIENQITAALPNVSIRDRWLVPRVTKRGGVLLDAEGKRSGHVPVRGHLVFED